MGELIRGIAGIVQEDGVRVALTGVALVAATLVLSRVITRVLRHLLNQDSNPLPTSSIIINVARVALWAAAGSLILDICFGIKANGLITALGVGGIAISLGFQSTLSNLIGGLTITLMGIVKPGDNIEVGAVSGVVEDVAWRHTTIHDALGQTVIIPNAVISTTSLVHLLPASRVVVPVTVGRTAADAAPGMEAGSADLDALAGRLAETALAAAGEVSPVAGTPKVVFSQITALGIEAKVIFEIADPARASAAADAVVRAVAPLVG